MSVKSMIERDDVKRILEPLLPRYERTQRVPIVVPRGSVSSAPLIGTAYDYAFRFELQRRCPHAQDRKWVAESGLARLVQDTSSLRTTLEAIKGLGTVSRGGEEFKSVRDLKPRFKIEKRARKRIENARIFHRKHLKRRKPDRAWMLRLGEYALKLARLDRMYRERHFHEDLFQPNRPEDVEEVVALLECTPFERFISPATVLLNPTFDTYSTRVGGADADLITGDMLIDLKVVAAPYIGPELIRQIVAYLILARCARRDGAPVPEIATLGIYLARHAHLFTISASAIVGNPAYPEAEKAFLACADRLFGEQAKSTRPGPPRNPFQDRSRM